MEPIKVGLLGFGTVGSGTFTVLNRNQEEIKRRAGRGIEVTRIAVRNPAKALAALGGDAGAAQITDDFNAGFEKGDVQKKVRILPLLVSRPLEVAGQPTGPVLYQGALAAL